jgi:eukaryotic-like serine/threonine-protein kinase
MPKTCPICGVTYSDTNAFCPADGTTLRADESNGDLIGTVIADRYLISKLLGEGGMGRVYLASHVRLPQQAAIKVLHPSMVQDSAAVARFNREAANAARIEHDRVARVFDFGETSNGLVYLAMEFVPGRSLASILEETPALPPVRAANLVFQVAEGLDAAHRMSIVHRDLKPDNIMVITDESGVDRAKVVDFGIAKVVDAAAAKGTQLTQAGTAIGTPQFMSPEQVFGEQLDARSDVYALALVGYQLFTGILPFDSSTPERALTARIVSDPKTLADAAPDIAWPPALQDAFNRALAREPAERTSSALDFADAVVAATEAWVGTPVLRSRTPLSNSALLTVAGASAPTPKSSPAATSAGSDPALRRTTAAAAGTPAGQSGSSTAVAPAKRSSTGLVLGGVGAVAVAAVALFMLKGGSEPAAAADAKPADAPAAVSADVPVPNADRGPGAPPPVRVAPGVASSGAPTSPTTTLPPASAGTGAPPKPQALSASADGEEARRSLEAIKRSLASADEAAAKEAIPQLKQLLGRLPASADSTWAYIYLVNAYGIADDPAGACGPLRLAKRLATTDAQLRAVANLVNSGAFVCAP